MEFADRASFYWGNLTWEELRDAAARKPVVIQPIGATEQHGYHLPLNTDNFIVTRLCDAAGRRAPDEMLVLPVIPFAFNAHHMDFPGVVAIKWDHVINYLVDVVESVAAHGFDRFIFISGHGVNPPYLAVAGNEVNVRTGALCASLLWTALADNVSEIRESILPGGMAHACELETAVMQYLDPRARAQRADRRRNGFRPGPLPPDGPRHHHRRPSRRALVEQFLPQWCRRGSEQGNGREGPIVVRPRRGQSSSSGA